MKAAVVTSAGTKPTFGEFMGMMGFGEAFNKRKW
jgi:hypothetical protein